MAFTEPSQDIELLGPDKGGAYGFTADEDVLAGQVVKIGSNQGVEPSDTDGEVVAGVATQTKASGDQVQVAGPGTRVRFTLGATANAGEWVASHGATGEEGQVTSAATGDYVIGMIFEGGSSGDTVRGIVLPGGQVN